MRNYYALLFCTGTNTRYALLDVSQTATLENCCQFNTFVDLICLSLKCMLGFLIMLLHQAYTFLWCEYLNIKSSIVSNRDRKQKKGFQTSSEYLCFWTNVTGSIT